MKFEWAVSYETVFMRLTRLKVRLLSLLLVDMGIYCGHGAQRCPEDHLRSISDARNY